MMTWKDLPRNPSSKTLRQFAAAWLVFFGIIAAQQYRHGYHDAGMVIGVLAVIVGVAGVIKPALLRWIFLGWMVLAFPIGWGVLPLVVILMYYVILYPVARPF